MFLFILEIGRCSFWWCKPRKRDIFIRPYRVCLDQRCRTKWITKSTSQSSWQKRTLSTPHFSMHYDFLIKVNLFCLVCPVSPSAIRAQTRAFSVARASTFLLLKERLSHLSSVSLPGSYTLVRGGVLVTQDEFKLRI